jgi:hypothetical protein
MRAQYKINFDRPPRLKKLPEALIITYIHDHTYKQTDTEDTNRDLDHRVETYRDVTSVPTFFVRMLGKLLDACI